MTIFHSTAAPLIQPPDSLTIPEFFLDGKQRHPTEPPVEKEVPCLIDESNGRRIYLAELRARTDYLARALRQKWGVKDGDIVTLISPNHIDYPVCAWATHRLGGVIAATSPSLTKDELVYQLEYAKPAIIISSIESLDTTLRAAASLNIAKTRIILLGADKKPVPGPFKTIEGLIKEGNSLSPVSGTALKSGDAKNKLAFLCFSSGTTGKPKAVSISHYNVICNVLQVATFTRTNEAYTSWENRRHKPGDVCTGVLPLYHIYGLVVNLHFMIYVKTTIVVSQKFDFVKMLQSIKDYRISHLLIVPPQAVLFCKHPAAEKADFSSVRYCMVAGAPVTAELVKQLLERLPDIQLGQGYGMTETCAAVTMFPVTQKVGTLGSAGQLVSGTVAKVVKGDGTLAKVGESGELHVQGGQVSPGYFQNDEATRETFVDGWIRTGDEVVFYPNGDLFIVDRIKELIKVKGFQVAPAELEGHLLEHPDIADAGVIGIHDDYSGEVPFAFVVLQPSVAKLVKRDKDMAARVRDNIFTHVSTAKSKHKWLTGGIEFIDVLPKSPSGKILRRILRDMAARMVRSTPAKL
ncbi:hypothetical protein AX17_004241 [Amanita inopinata Kibby_2008]|nr:hypothetical protein AX17_004241 [Amanita inopinata Kibby_2008]